MELAGAGREAHQAPHGASGEAGGTSGGGCGCIAGRAHARGWHTAGPHQIARAGSGVGRALGWDSWLLA
eukprot:14831602-Alexandrium_andersonii.AAC.1